MSAARTYLIIAVFGGMVTLMGLFMAWHALGSLSFDAFEAARGRTDMAVPAALILALVFHRVESVWWSFFIAEFAALTYGFLTFSKLYNKEIKHLPDGAAV